MVGRRHYREGAESITRTVEGAYGTQRLVRKHVATQVISVVFQKGTPFFIT